MRVLFIWEVNERLQNYLLGHPLKSETMEFVFLKNKQLQQLEVEQAENIQAVVGWVGQQSFLPKLFKKLKHVELIMNPAVGVDRAIPFVRTLDKTHDITLCNSHAHTHFTAQHAVGMLLSLSNRLMLHHNFMKAGVWRMGEKEGASFPLKYRKTGLLGYGPINRFAHRFLEGFDTEIHILKNTLTKEQKAHPHFYTQSQLHDFLEAVDNLIIAVPLTKKTAGMIGKKELNLLGKSGILINVARGKVVKEKALYKALKKQKILGAGSDVWYNYSPTPDDEGRKYPYDYPFHKLENVLLSPHRGGSPLNDLNRWDETMEILSLFEKGEDLINVVDLERGY